MSTVPPPAPKGDTATPSAAPARTPPAVQPQRATPVSVVPAHLERVVIRPYPKTIFMYPLALVSLLCGVMSLIPSFAAAHGATLGFIFVLVFFFNIIVMSFEFTRHVSVALVLSAFVVILLGLLLNERVELKHFLGQVYGRLHFVANAPFYFAISGAYALCLGGIIFDTHMDYWEVRGNEVLHHHGFLGDIERYPAPSLKMRKEITDVFEYLLLLSGRLVIYPTGSE
ncbi:MAG: hypothetical protein ACRELB_24940, partial [Polyangiaceae bacterium]